MAFSVVAAVTDVGRQRLAQMMITGKSFQVNKFTVGSGGHDPLDPVTALTPDTSLNECPSPVFGPEPIDSTTLLTQFCPQFTCTLGFNEAVAPVSNICLVATIIYSPIPSDPEVGSTFIFAIANFPLRVKLDTEVVDINVSVQF